MESLLLVALTLAFIGLTFSLIVFFKLVFPRKFIKKIEIDISSPNM